MSPRGAVENALGEYAVCRGPVGGRRGWTVIGFERVFRGDQCGVLCLWLMVVRGWQM